MADERLEVAIKAVNDASRALKEVQKDLEGTEKSGGKASGALQKVGTAMGKTISVAKNVGVAIGGVALAMNQIFEMGKAGATVIQTGESFERLTKNATGTRDILKEMQKATRGTVDDMTLMKTVLTLTAGSSQDMSTKLVEAAPRLAEIAKAANKLNPSLGDTTFFMDSLGLAIKRTSPMIADNLGILVKVGPANEAYAASIGKTVDQLSAEEKQIAFLNALLEKGDTLLDQVGGSTESAGDAFGRLDTATKNLGDAIMAKLAPPLADAAEGLNLLITGSGKLSDAFLEQQDRMKGLVFATDSTRVSVKDYNAEILRSATLTGDAVKIVKGMAESWEKAGRTIVTVDGQMYALDQSVQLLTESQVEAMKQSQKLTDERYGEIEALRAHRGAIEEVSGATEDLIEDQDALKEAMGRLQMIIDGPVGKANEALVTDLDKLRDKEKELIDQLGELEGAHGRVVVSQSKSSLSAEDLAYKKSLLADKIAKLSEMEDQSGTAALKLAADIAKLRGQVDGVSGSTTSWVDNSKKMSEIRSELDETRGAMDALQAAHDENTKRFLFNLASRQLAMDGLTSNEISALTALGQQWGIYDQQTATAITDTLNATLRLAEDQNINVFASNMNDALARTSGDLGQATEQADRARNAISQLASLNNTEIRIRTIYENITRSIQENAGQTPGGGRQHGGPVYAGGVHTVGEGGREIFFPQVNGSIVDARRADQMIGLLGVMAGIMGDSRKRNGMQRGDNGSSFGGGAGIAGTRAGAF